LPGGITGRRHQDGVSTDLVEDLQHVVEATQHPQSMLFEVLPLLRVRHTGAHDEQAGPGIPAQPAGEIQDSNVATHEHDVLIHEPLPPRTVQPPSVDRAVDEGEHGRDGDADEQQPRHFREGGNLSRIARHGDRDDPSDAYPPVLGGAGAV
jgi:hypothetical protein